jgi:hypothetical protein
MISIHLFQASTKIPLRLGSQPNPKIPHQQLSDPEHAQLKKTCIF